MQKNRAESYAEKLHTDYVRMQEDLERDYEKACKERDEIRAAHELDIMALVKMKEQNKGLKVENAALKQHMGVIKERTKKVEEENGRMKIALEALLARSRAVNNDAKSKLDDAGATRGKTDPKQISNPNLDHSSRSGSVNEQGPLIGSSENL